MGMFRGNRMSDEDYQAMKIVLRANGYIPTTKLIYEMRDKMDKELSALRLAQIDDLCHEDWLKREDERRAEHRSFQRRLLRFTAIGTALEIEDDNPYLERRE